MATTRSKNTITYEAAATMVAAAVAKARELGCLQNAAVVDEGGNLVAFGRMDGAAILGTEGCQRKAFTALFGIGTQDLAERVKDNPGVLHGLSHFRGATMVGGGLPIAIDGEVVGGIGRGRRQRRRRHRLRASRSRRLEVAAPGDPSHARRGGGVPPRNGSAASRRKDTPRRRAARATRRPPLELRCETPPPRRGWMPARKHVRDDTALPSLRA